MNALRTVMMVFGLMMLAATASAQAVVYQGTSGPGVGKHIVFLAGDHEYRSEETLPQLARILAKHHGFKCSVLFNVNQDSGEIAPGNSNMPGMEALSTADLAVVFLRFQNFPQEQMRHLDDYLNRGGPVVGLRTATHAFKIKGTDPFGKYSYDHKDAAYELGFFLMFFDTLPSSQRTRVLTHYNLANTSAWFCGSLLGGWYLMHMGATPAAYHTLFFASTAGRLCALGLLWNIDRPILPSLQLASTHLRHSIYAWLEPKPQQTPALSFFAWKSFFPSKHRNHLLQSVAQPASTTTIPIPATVVTNTLELPREESLQAA